MPTVNLTLTGQAFASVNDTNVTLTLGGTPLTALLKGVSITAGWTGQLSVARGGTGLGALGTANQLLRVNALGTALEYFTPSYGTGTVTSFAFTDSTGITGSVLNATTTPTLSLSLTSAAVGLGNVENTALSTWAGSTNLVTLGSAVTGTGSLTLGTASSVAGQLTLSNATNAFTQTIRGTNPSASIIYDLPTTAPTLGQVLSATAPAAGVVTLSWATAASGISIGDAIGNSPVTGSVLMAIGGVITQSISYRAQQATPFGTAFGFASMSGNTGVNNTAFGYNSGLGQTTGTNNIYLGWNAGFRNISGNRNIYLGGIAGDTLATNQSDNIFIGVGAGLNSTGGQNIVIGAGSQSGAGLQTGNTSIGHQAMFNSTSTPDYNVAVGWRAGYSMSADYNTYIGPGAGYASTTSSSIGIGIYATPSQNNEMMIGGSIADFFTSTAGITNVCIGNGNTHASPASVAIRISSGSGTNISGSTFTLAGSKGTGSGTPGTWRVQTSTTLGSGTTLQSLVTRLTISGGAVTTDASTATWAEALDFVFGTTTGTKFGTSTSQKLSFWNKTPIVQPTTAIASATVVHVGGTTYQENDTIGGYTLAQIVQALQNVGILA